MREKVVRHFLISQGDSQSLSQQYVKTHLTLYYRITKVTSTVRRQSSHMLRSQKVVGKSITSLLPYVLHAPTILEKPGSVPEGKVKKRSKAKFYNRIRHALFETSPRRLLWFLCKKVFFE